jgi:ketosteroid isomerase-like protein
MKLSVVLMLAALAPAGCAKQQAAADGASASTTSVTNAPATSDADEQAAVKKVIADFQSAYMAKDWSRMEGLFSGDLKFFGTDSAEVIRSVADFRKQMTDDWQVIDSPKLEGTRNLSIILDRDHEVASAIYETPFSGKAGGEMMSGTMRFAQTFRKENGNWKLVHGLVSMATVGQSSAAMIEQMKKGKM